MAVYIAADTNFCQSDERDAELMLNWNAKVNEDDLVILMGDVVYHGASSWERVEEIFDQLIGKKKLIGISQEEEGAEEWRKITHHKCFRVDAAVLGEIKGEQTKVFIYSTLHPEIRDKQMKKKNLYGAAPRSLTGNKEIFEDNIISISIDDWGLEPIEYFRIPQMIDDMLLFESMETKEEKIDEN